MNDHPFFSIIIPSYNSSKYITATLLSVAEQTFKDFEVIVVDDGSTDQSLKLCNEAFEEYQFKGEVVQRSHEWEKGVASCRNLGVKIAKGEWICFLDGDDMFTENKLHETYRSIKAFGETCLAYYHSAEKFDDVTGEVIQVTGSIQTAATEDILVKLLKQNFIATSAVTLSKQLFNSCGGFDTSLNGVEDYLMWLRVAKKTKWHYNRNILCKYRVRQLSLMNGRRMTYYVYQNYALRRALKLSGEFNDSEIRAMRKGSHEVMDYYSMMSLASYGFADFLYGIWELIKRGEYRIAFHLALKHARQIGLKKATMIFGSAKS